MLELITDHWSKIGISLFIRTSQRDMFRSRAIGGEIMMAIWSGIDNGVPTADMNPGELAPTVDDQLQWPVWGMHYLSHGEKGTAPDLPEACRAVELCKQWRSSADAGGRTAIWHQMLALFTDQVFSIGIVNADAAAGAVARAGCATCPTKGSTASIRPAISASTCRTRSGSKESTDVLRYILWRIAVMVPTLLIISALVFTIIELPPGDYFESYIAELQAQPAKASTSSRSRSCASNTASTSRRCCAISTGSAACCTAISAIPSNTSCRSATWSATGCG